MKKFLFLLVILLTINIFASNEEFIFIKKVNSSLSDSKMLKIKNAIDEHFHYVDEYLDNTKMIYVLIANESTFKTNAKLKDKFDVNKGLLQVQKGTYDYLYDKKIIKKYEWYKINSINYNIKIGLIILQMKFKAVKQFKPKNTTEWTNMAFIAYNKGEGKLKEDIEIDNRRDFHNFTYIRSLRRFLNIINS